MKRWSRITCKQALWASVVILIIWYIFIFIFKNRSQEHYEQDTEDQHIIFYSKVEAIKLFRTDPDAYFERLTSLDMHAMKVISTDDAIDQMCKASRSFTMKEKVKLSQAIEEADRFLRQVKLPYFDGVKCAEIRWKLVVTIGRANEEGMPHTKGDIIYLSDEVVNENMTPLIATLIHEKVHVYERMYPHLMAQWIRANGYQLYRRQSTIPTARSNPDVDGWTYLDPTGKETVVHYNVTYKKNVNVSEREKFRLDQYDALPEGIQDAQYPHGDDPASEHPNEKLAYTLDHLYTAQRGSLN